MLVFKQIDPLGLFGHSSDLPNIQVSVRSKS